jgi:hypothetical protein
MSVWWGRIWSGAAVGKKIGESSVMVGAREAKKIVHATFARLLKRSNSLRVLYYRFLPRHCHTCVRRFRQGGFPLEA